ncbi:Uncharacterized protein wiht hemolysin-type calcium-binding regions [Synechococcus sp. RCC307]|nr:Uncharacterized protein wiht hemolysin-type calcium-binding regions [Synechococcus sp. RCC307]
MAIFDYQWCLVSVEHNAKIGFAAAPYVEIVESSFISGSTYWQFTADTDGVREYWRIIGKNMTGQNLVINKIQVDSEEMGYYEVKGVNWTYQNIMNLTDSEFLTLATRGNDVIIGSRYNDSLAGEIGNDKIKGGNGNDRLSGGRGIDSLYGGSGQDVVNGGVGNDSINGGSGRDTAVFSSRKNRINLKTTKWQNTGDGRDRLISIENVNAGSGNDVVTGNRSANTLNGQNGNDVLNGAAGNDYLLGGRGNDRLKGGSGNDKLVGGQGNDKLWGGSGRDTFVLSEGSGYDRIMDFRNGQDRIQMGSGVDNLKIQNRNGHAFVYEGRDLMAVVNGAAGDLQERGNFLV